MKLIDKAKIENGTIVLVRVDWNLPIDEDKNIIDSSRILSSVKTINYLIEKGAKVVVLSHFGDGDESLEIVLPEVEKYFPEIRIRFVNDPWNHSSQSGMKAIEDMRGGEMAIFENLRFWAEKENDECFAKKLADFGDIYVNEAFSASHREHSSIVLIPKFLPSYAGFSFLNEFDNLSKALNPEHPFLFILGGVKFDTKIPLVTKFLDIADSIFIGGAMAKRAYQMREFREKEFEGKIIFPVGEKDALDANTETLELLYEKIANSKFVLWNGPLGNYEKGYIAGTTALARTLFESDKKVIIGGGDTYTVIKNAGINIESILKENKNIFVSTSGGAMLDFLANGTLPGIEALENCNVY
jgi:phosphoglycerate kinase